MKVIYIGLIMLMGTTMTFAQGGGRDRGPQMDREKLQTARIAFLTNRLELDTETAKVFWPIFTEYDKEKSELSKKYWAQKRVLFTEGTRNITDENADKMLVIYLDQKQVELDLEKKYLSRFKKVLAPRQVWHIIRFDSDFRRDIFERASRDRKEKGRSGESKTGGN